MPVLDMVYYPDSPLTETARSVEKFDKKLSELAGNMLETMHAYQGVGLAAPQVGVSKRLFVCHEPEGEEMCLVNPVIFDAEGSEVGEEGCLSMPGLYAMVPRATSIRVEAQDLGGARIEFAAQDFLARIIQHETDHLDGILFPERLDIISRQGLYEDWNARRDELIAAAAEG